ncbi:class V aminotransferase [Thioalkalivibrio denitrificans]|uniref:Class V aminotransferase n=1 Tax=Thioalkalivibrio denitrificans TaxID=108003 RepID=A0A1V3N859_9GAMM|nr:aminotransferase class V-fold PLP-dependent enzyme [Thioalkalivibrio denitrificans]OOG21012.1 class V aminotransferase [Thioalkalivibrio denitrificans]
MHPEFPLEPGLIHLNHAAVGPWPRRAVEAVERFARANMHEGSRAYPHWIREETRLRGLLARLINAPSADDIALLKNTSEALSVVAYGLEWASGDNVVSARQEFPSNRVVWQSLAPRFGVQARLVDLEGPDPEGALIEAMDARTRLLSISAVQYARGLRLDLERLGEACHRRGVLFCVDAIQQLGALPFDAQACRADFVAADGHKWMLGPEGVAVFFVRPEVRDRLRLNQFGWHMLEALGDFDRPDWQPAASARRFECGSPNLLGVHALAASLDLLLETGLDTISDNISRNISLLIDILSEKGFEILSPTAPERRAGIVTFTRPGTDMEAICQRLMQSGVLCAHRGGGLRFSPHFHNAESDLLEAVERIGDGR